MTIMGEHHLNKTEFEKIWRDAGIEDLIYNHSLEALAVAVSGGPDSMALLHLIEELFQQNNKIRLYALTVDHSLRPESSQEALRINNFLNKKKIKHIILKWDHNTPKHIGVSSESSAYVINCASL